MKRLFALLTIVALVLTGCGRTSKATPSPAVEEVTRESPATPGAELEVSELVEMLRPSTVLIVAQFAGDEAGTGTGIIYNADGRAITNAHVVEGAVILKVQAPGTSRWLSAKIVGLSPCDDLAVIDIAGSGFTPATLGESDDLKLGEELIALGYPLAADLGTDLTVTRGIVSKLHAQLDQLEDLIQTDASINPGNSGGPLVNMRGEVVGINTVKVEYTASGRPVQGLNFAIGTSFAKEVVAELQWGQNLHWVGLNTIPNDAEVADHFGLSTSEGLVVYATASGSPAANTDIQPGDVLVRMEGVPVNSKADLCSILKSHHPDDVLQAEILRGDSLLRRQIGGPTSATPKSPSEAGARIGSIIFALDVTEDDEPINPGTAFPAGTTMVYAIFAYEGIERGTTFKYIWYLDGEEDVGDADMWESAESGTYWVNLYNDDGLVSGTYELQLFVEDRLVQTGSFAIGGAPAKGDGAPIIGSITFATALTDDDEPINPGRVFPPGTTYVYGVFEYSGMPADAEFRYVYYRDGEEDVGNALIWTHDSDGTYYVYIYNDDGVIPGSYELFLYVDGVLLQESSFIVQDTGEDEALETYSDETLGFALQFPRGWELDEGSDMVFFSDPGSTVFAFVAVSLAEGDQTVQELSVGFLEGMQEDYPDLEVADVQEGSFAGHPALITTADFSYDDDDMRVILYSVVRDGVGYSMGEVGQEGDLNDLMDDFLDPIWDTFYFLD